MRVAHIKFARRVLGAATLLALAAVMTPASAQTQAASGVGVNEGNTMTGIGIGTGPAVDEATLEKRKEIEEAYKRTTKSQPVVTNAVNDPWANMRGPEEQKSAAKTAAKTAPKKKPAQ